MQFIFVNETEIELLRFWHINLNVSDPDSKHMYDSGRSFSKNSNVVFGKRLDCH